MDKNNRSLQDFRAARDFLLAHREDYHEAKANFRWPVIENFNWAFEWFDTIAVSERGDQIALHIVTDEGSETRLSYRELSDRSSQMANYFRSLGMRSGERILLMVGNLPHLWEAMLAAMKLGVVVVPTTTMLTPIEISDRIERGEVSYIIATIENTQKCEIVRHRAMGISISGTSAGWRAYEEGYKHSRRFEPDGITSGHAPFQLYFTSGTTTKPKLVLHTHLSYPVGHLSTMYWLGLQPGDVHLNLSSPGWAKHSWSSFFAPWNAEAPVFVYNQPRFNPQGLLEALARHKVTSFCAPPTVWRMLIKEDLKKWKVQLSKAASAGEPLNAEVINRIRDAWGVTIRDGYGQTETTAIVGNPPGQKLKIGSMGRPLPGYDVILLDSEGQQAAEGEICITLASRPTGLMPGYCDEHGSMIPIQGDVYRTGDIASRSPDGYLTFVGRADDVFKSSDYRISPFELESALVKHPDVLECAVVPVPDPIRLAVPKAFITLRPSAKPSRDMALSIFKHIRENLAPYKRVRRIEFVDLPKTVSGKIRRVELRRSEEKKCDSDSLSSSEFREDNFPEL